MKRLQTRENGAWSQNKINLQSKTKNIVEWEIILRAKTVINI
jgi:hypothetical protein